ncbi:acyl-CoA dehydrogenase C-terminal domain-containing protein [Paraburkholderia sp. BL6669N2]|uniref:acyl-CoA dehydrogenase C-terminal domain-containing protein n=1 Tax=Paraburkholderia sp. BL6669N2 TaxID=1938807 RepID=UPI000E2549B0|nr:acyl-CoA dehydrogenase C-terminal domain-containing protein [Paraburkholderia sp. BL6669N2]
MNTYIAPLRDMQFVMTELASLDKALINPVDYPILIGYVCGGWQMAGAALAASISNAAGDDRDFDLAKIATAHFYADRILPTTSALLETIRSGASAALG